MLKKIGKNVFFDADRKKTISYSCSTPQYKKIEEKTLFLDVVLLDLYREKKN